MENKAFEEWWEKKSQKLLTILMNLGIDTADARIIAEAVFGEMQAEYANHINLERYSDPHPSTQSSIAVEDREGWSIFFLRLAGMPHGSPVGAIRKSILAASPDLEPRLAFDLGKTIADASHGMINPQESH